MYGSGHLGINAGGSSYAFSYWESPDVGVEDGKLYRSTWTMGSSATGSDSAVQFRLRINQKGAWSAWERVVNSINGQAPSVGNNKDYLVFFNPRVTGASDNVVVFNFDIMSFDPGDDTSSWLYLEELMVDEVGYGINTVLATYNFTSDSEGWTFAGAIPPYDAPVSSVIPEYIGLSPNGSTNCFSYWESPDITIQDNRIYGVWWQVASSVTDPDTCVQFRLRANQKGSWQSWDRIVNSNLQNAPTTGRRTYYFIMNPDVTGGSDNLVVLSFDILSFDPGDDTTSWLYLDMASVQDLSISP